MSRRRGGGGFKLFVIALLILVGGAGAAGYIYLNETQFKPKAEVERNLAIARTEGLRAKELFFKQDYDAVFKAAQNVIDAALHAERDLSQGYFWAARVHLRKYQEGHPYPSAWNVGGVIRFTPTVPDDADTTFRRTEVLKQMKLSRDADHSMIGEWARSCADGILALLEGRYAEAEAKLAETVRSPDADPELQIYLALARLLQKKFKEAAEGIEPHLSRIAFIDARTTWAKAMQGMGLEAHVAGADPAPIYRKAVSNLQGVASPRAAAAQAEILINWGDYLADRGYGEADVLAKYDEAAAVGEPLSSAVAKVARARWLIDHGQPKLAKTFLEDANRTLDGAVQKEVVNPNLLVRRELAVLTFAQYLRETGDRAAAAERAAPVLKEVDAAIESKETLDSDRLALATYREWIAWTVADGAPEREKAARELERLSKSHPSDPWPAIEAAQLFRMTGDEVAREGGDPSPQYAPAIRLAGNALGLKQDFVQALAIRGATFVGIAADALRKGQDPGEALQLADADFAAALRINDKLAEAYRLRGIGQGIRGAYLADQGGDAAEAVEAAIRDFDAALKIQSRWAEVYLDRAKARITMARSLEARGEEPGDAFNRADEDLSRAVDLRSSFAEAYGLRAEVRLLRGQRTRRQGKDPTPLFEQAARDVTEALRFKADFAEGFRLRGAARLFTGEHQMATGKDPTGAFEAAQQDLDRATELRTHDPEAHSLRGQLMFRRGSFAQMRGQDPSADYDAAIQSLDRALDLHGKLLEARLARGLTRAHAAEYARRKGGDPKGELNGAVEDFDAVTGVRPKEVRALIGRARARRQLGAEQRATGGDAASTLRQAVEDASGALAVDSALVEAMAVRAAARAELAEALLMTGKDPGAEIRAALADAADALKRSPAYEEAFLARSHAQRVSGLHKGFQGAKDLDDFNKAAQDAEAAAKANPNSARARRARAEALLWWSWILEWRGDSGVQQYSQGLKAAEEGLSIDASDPALQSLKGWAIGLEATHLRVAGAVPTSRYEAALQELDRAVEMAPHDPAVAWRRAETLFGFVVWLRLRNDMVRADEASRKGLEDVRRAIAANSNDPLPLVVRSRFHKQVGRFDDARGDAASAIRACVWMRALVGP
jgi:hypothetical protein